MDKKTIRTSIEKRFVMSILWVGVIPMILALLIGYVAAREGQQIAVRQNLATAASKTVDGIRLAVRERERIIVRIAQMPEVVAYLRSHGAGEDFDEAPVLERFALESKASATRESIFCLYDATGEPVVTQAGLEAPTISNLDAIDRPRFVDLQYLPAQNRYAALLVTPVKDPDSDTILGYLGESQNIHELLMLMLTEGDGAAPYQSDRYEILVLDGNTQFVVYLDEHAAITPPPPTFSELNPGLRDRILASPERDQDSFMLWSYDSRGTKQPVLLAYRRLTPDLPVYIAAHRPTPEVFAIINRAAIATILASALLIGVFCAIAYRIVNNTIIQPVSLLNEGAQIIRQGDLDLKLKVETGDEIEELASSFNQMAAALRANVHRLRSSEEKYRNLVTSMRDGVFQTTGNHIITFINPAGAAILGYDNIGEVLGRSLREFFVHEEEFEHVAGEISEEPYIESVRIWLKQHNQKDVCVEMSGIRLFGARGELTGIDGAFRDVSRNVRLEKEVSDRAERMAAINQIANAVNASLEPERVYANLTREVRWLVNFDYAAVSLGLDDGTFETRQLWPEPREGHEQFPRIDDNNSCTGWVAREERCLIVDNLGESTSEFAFQFPAEIKSCLCVPLHAEQKIIGALHFGSKQAARFTEEDAHMLEQIAPHLASAIRNARLLEHLRQALEEATQARKKLHAANEELKSLDEMKTNLLSNVSHELRTPLVAVMGYTDMVLNGKVGPTNDLQREYLGITLRNVEKLVSLIENLLDFSRLHKGAEELVFTRFDLLECINASMQSVKPVADGRKIELTLHAHDSDDTPISPPLLVEGDKGKLGQVFNNLLSNAVKFNKNEGKVTVDVEVRKDTAHIAISDTGIGLPEEALDRIFMRFYQYDASSTRKYGGTGIGLSIAQDIVRLHGSRITVFSKVGEGSTFRFSLPLHLGSSASDTSDEEVRPLPTETHLLIEIVSQDRALSAQLRNSLVSEGMDIIHAIYPAAAISMAQRYNPDCILVDTESGPSSSLLLDDLLTKPLAVSAPIIMLTDDDDLYNRYAHHVAARIKRSFRKSTLLSGIHYALSQGVPSGHNLGNKILCVDDDPENATFISRCLAEDQYTVDCCDSGEKALEMAASGQYWLVLLDIAISDMDGWKVCQRLKGNGELAGIKVYVVTAKSVEAESQAFRESGADGYLLKPFKADDIVSVVRSFDVQRDRSQFL